VDVDFVMRRPLPELWKFSTAPVAPYISSNQPARPRLPGLPLGVRITPNWVSTYATLAQYLDYTWAQYNSRQGDPQAYFDAAADGAAKLGLRVVMGLNVEDCSGGGTASCPGAADGALGGRGPLAWARNRIPPAAAAAPERGGASRRPVPQQYQPDAWRPNDMRISCGAIVPAPRQTYASLVALTGGCRPRGARRPSGPSAACAG